MPKLNKITLDFPPPAHPDAPTDDQYEAFRLLREEGLPRDEVARRMGRSGSTVDKLCAAYELKQYGRTLGRSLGRRRPAKMLQLSAVEGAAERVTA